MVWNQKVAFRIFLIILFFVFSFIFYFAFFSQDNGAEEFFGSIGFDSSENAEDTPAVALPSGDGSGSSSSIGSSSGSGGSGGGSSGSSGTVPSTLSFCTFDALHTITSDVPCRCGFSGVCYEEESVCDATFNNGEGYCS